MDDLILEFIYGIDDVTEKFIQHIVFTDRIFDKPIWHFFKWEQSTSLIKTGDKIERYMFICLN